MRFRLLTSILIFIVSCCKAQIHHIDFGLIAGANFGEVDISTIGPTIPKNMISPVIGGYVGIPINRKWYLENEILYNRCNLKMIDYWSLGSPAQNKSLTYIDDALILKCTFGPIGGFIGIKLSTLTKSPENVKDSISNGENIRVEYKPLACSPLFGVEYAHQSGWSLFLNFGVFGTNNVVKYGRNNDYPATPYVRKDYLNLGIKKRLFRWRNSRFYHE